MSSDIMTTARLSKAVRMYNNGPRFLLGMTVEFPNSGLILSGCVEPETWLRYFGLERATKATIIGSTYITRNINSQWAPFTITKKVVEGPAPEVINIWEVLPTARSHHEFIVRAIRPVVPADRTWVEGIIIPDDGTLPW